jgi:hypothetical protein
VFIALFGIAIRESPPTSVNAAPTNIVLARDVDSPAHHPFAREVSCSVPDGSKTCTASFAVDAGKELIIETTSVFATIPIGGRAFGVIRAVTGGTNLSSVQLPLAFQASYAGTVDTYAGTQSLRLYADPGSTVSVGGGEQPVGSAQFIFDVSGYTVDCGSSGSTITNPCPVP